jgi:hypothetical protein
VTVAQHLISDTTPAAASTAIGDVIVGLGNYDSLQIVADLVGATGGTLDVYLQTSPDGGTTWYDYAHFPQLLAAAAAIRYMVNVSSRTTSSIVVVGKGTTPALALNTVVGGTWGDRLRALYVAGAATSAGAAITISIVGYTRRR